MVVRASMRPSYRSAWRSWSIPRRAAGQVHMCLHGQVCMHPRRHPPQWTPQKTPQDRSPQETPNGTYRRVPQPSPPKLRSERSSRPSCRWERAQLLALPRLPGPLPASVTCLRHPWQEAGLLHVPPAQPLAQVQRLLLPRDRQLPLAAAPRVAHSDLQQTVFGDPLFSAAPRVVHTDWWRRKGTGPGTWG